jgi:hypothetical protein
LRWLKVVEKDLRGIKIKRWRRKADDRKEWVSVIERPRLSKGRRAEESVSK